MRKCFSTKHLRYGSFFIVISIKNKPPTSGLRVTLKVALNYASEHNVFKRDARGYRCQIYRGMLDAIFAILFRNDPKDIEILQTW